MIVTRFHYPLEARLIKKIDMMAKRCVQRNPKKDAVLLIEGAEGEGKTSLSVAIAYYVSEKTQREFTHRNIFFDVEKMIKFLQDTEGQIAIWDEPTLQALSRDSRSKVVANLKRMLMMCRNKRHFIIINMTYFTEFENYVVWQRPLGMIHVYSRGNTAGRFVYVKKKNLERLWMDWKGKKQRNYYKYASKGCRGTFPDVLNDEYDNNVLSAFNYRAYEDNKNNAISSIGKTEIKLNARDIQRRKLIEIIKRNDESPNKISDKDIAKLLGISLRTIYRLKTLPLENASAINDTNNTYGIDDNQPQIVVEKQTENAEQLQ